MMGRILLVFPLNLLAELQTAQTVLSTCRAGLGITRTLSGRGRGGLLQAQLSCTQAVDILLRLSASAS